MNQTTQKLFERLEEKIENYNPEENGGVTKEQLQIDYATFKYVSQTLNEQELQLLLYLRLLPNEMKIRFYKAIENVYRTFNEIQNLAEIKVETYKH